MAIISHPSNKNYRNNFEEIFGKKPAPARGTAPSNLTQQDIAMGAVWMMTINQCKFCGALWRFFSDRTCSLVPGMTAGRCCDNVEMELEQVWPSKPRAFVAYPKNLPPRRNGGVLCDMWIGACACGATHLGADDVLERRP